MFFHTAIITRFIRLVFATKYRQHSAIQRMPWITELQFPAAVCFVSWVCIINSGRIKGSAMCDLRNATCRRPNLSDDRSSGRNRLPRIAGWAAQALRTQGGVEIFDGNYFIVVSFGNRGRFVRFLLGDYLPFTSRIRSCFQFIDHAFLLSPLKVGDNDSGNIYRKSFPRFTFRCVSVLSPQAYFVSSFSVRQVC